MPSSSPSRGQRQDSKAERTDLSRGTGGDSASRGWASAPEVSTGSRALALTSGSAGERRPRRYTRLDAAPVPPPRPPPRPPVRPGAESGALGAGLRPPAELNRVTRSCLPRASCFRWVTRGAAPGRDGRPRPQPPSPRGAPPPPPLAARRGESPAWVLTHGTQPLRGDALPCHTEQPLTVTLTLRKWQCTWPLTLQCHSVALHPGPHRGAPRSRSGWLHSHTHTGSGRSDRAIRCVM